MQRVVVIGSPGAGKSVFADELGRRLGIEVFHLDELYWQAGSPPAPARWAAVEREVVERERWIADGNYSATLAARLDAADAAIFLDLPRRTCLARFVRRRFSRTATGMPRDRRAYLSWEALRGIATFPRDHRPGFLELLAEHEDGLRVVVLRRPDEVRDFLTWLAEERA